MAAITILIDIDTEIVQFAETHRGSKSLNEKLNELLYTGVQKAGMPRPTKQGP